MNEFQLLATYLTDKLNLIITSLNGKVTEAESLAAVRNGVATDGDDLNKLRNLIAGLAAIQLTLDDILTNGNDAQGTAIQLNGAGASLSGALGTFGTINAFLEATGLIYLKSANDVVNMRNNADFDLSFVLSGLTASRQWTIQDKPITVAGLDDITTAINNLINGAPGALDALNEFADALNNDPNFATTMTNALAAKLALSGGTMTGDVDFTTNSVALQTNKIKTTAALLEWYIGADKMVHDFSAIIGGLGTYTLNWRAKSGVPAMLDDIINAIVGALSTETSHTGTTAETFIDGFMIPANTLEAGDYIEIRYAMSKVGSAGTAILRARVNTTGGTVSGDTIVYKSVPSYVPNPTNDVTMLKVISGANPLFYIGDIDWGVDQYVDITMQLGNTADLLTIESFYIKRYKA